VKRVFSSFNQTAVYHARNLLETSGIQVMVKNAILSSAMGELPPAECQAELWVLDERDELRALEILLPKPVSGAEWTCACGETLAAQFTQCWKCGSYRSA
jgi:Putative prokaryotic signal transducing protein